MKIKEFSEVKEGDKGYTYNGDEVEIIEKGTLDDMEYYDYEVVRDCYYDGYTKETPAVLVSEDGNYYVYVYGEDGVYVKA